MDATDGRVGVDGRLLPAIGASWPVAAGPVTVTFSAGFAAGQCPGALVSAVKLMLGHLFANREAVVTSGTVSELPLGVQTLCALYRSVERRCGKEWGRTVRFRWVPYHLK